GRTVVSVSLSGFMSEGDPTRGTAVAVRRLFGKDKWLEYRGSFERAAASPDGKRLLTWHDQARLWDLATGSELSELKQYFRSAFTFSPDSKLFAVAVQGEISIRDAVTGKRVIEIAFPF